MKVQRFIEKLSQCQNLLEEEAYEAAITFMEGTATEAQMASILLALRMKGETIEEITGFVRAMRDKMVKISAKAQDFLVDNCGTGGDQKGTFNVSTVSAIVASAAGCRVAKHGNRAISSSCGSADLLKELGINIEMPPQQSERCLNETGITFLFAPLYHPAMKRVTKPRRELGIRTIFNVVGPLTNPVLVKRQLIGVFDAELTEVLVKVLKKLGSRHCLVVHGEEGIDEISISGKTLIAELKDGKISNYFIQPEDFGIKRYPPESIKGGSPRENARIAMQVLKGEKGPYRDSVLLNAGAVIYVSGKASSLKEGVEMAAEAIDSGRAFRKLEEFRNFSLRREAQ